MGLVGGYEAPAQGLGALGLTFGASSSQLGEDGAAGAENLTSNLIDAGGYWRLTRGAFSLNARVAGDYLSVSSDRVVQTLSADGVGVSRTATGHWSGYGVNGRIRASYEVHLRNAYLRPQASVDYFQLKEGSYSEQGGGDAVNLAVDSRTSSRLSGFAGVAVGAVFGEGDSTWGPELLLGYRDVAKETLGDTTARFLSGGDAFTLHADQLGGQGLAARLSYKGENGSGGFAVESGAELRDGVSIYDVRLTAHFLF
jgi:hypothetical protein